jgi:hypothetical protein
VGVQERAEAHLGVPDVLAGVVLAELEGDAVDRFRVLHDGQGRVERGQVVLEAPGIRRYEALAEPGLVVGREGDVPLPCELEHGARTQRSVEMDVKLGFGKREEPLSASLPRQHAPGPSAEAKPFSTSTSGAG